mgnify:CR=1 FL=1
MEELLFMGDYEVARFILQRALALIYLIAFSVTLNQFPALVGEDGLQPIRPFLERISFWRAPSIFHWHYSDRFLRAVSWGGILLSIAAFASFLVPLPVWLYMLNWFILWALYLSIVNVGQTFYGFGWESKLLEAGFYAIILGPVHVATPLLLIWIFNWLIFRVEFGAGLIKIRGDQCWRDLTCMYYHQETQPMPNPLSRYFHLSPGPFHRLETLFNHIVQLGIIWFIFFPQPIASIAAGLIILSQLYLVISGNYSWLNWMTIFLAVSGISDPVFHMVLGSTQWIPPAAGAPLYFQILVGILTLLVAYLSIEPIRNLISRNQLMNFSFNPFHLVNTYGAFGSVTKERYEIIIEGTNDPTGNPEAEWKAYEFKAKPGDTRRMPPQIAPYHLRLDWQMWFAAMSSYLHHPWFPRLLRKILKGEEATINLLKSNPFPDEPPAYIRARLFHYRYANVEERRETGQWWIRRYVKDYYPSTSRKELKTIK